MKKWKLLIIKNMKVLVCISLICLYMYTTFLDKRYDDGFIMFVSMMLLGVGNGIYWLYMLLSNKIELIPAIIITCFTWPIASLIGTIVLIPVVLFEIVFLVVCCFMPTKEEDKFSIENMEVEMKVNQCCKSRAIIDSLFFLVTMSLLVLFILLRFTSIGAVIFIIAWLIICKCLIFLWNMKKIDQFNYLIVEDCDSHVFCEVFQFLNRQYPKDYHILQLYITALLYDDNDDCELKAIIYKYQQCKSHDYYLKALVAVSEGEEKATAFQKFYKKSYFSNQKAYRKTKLKVYKNRMLYLEIECLTQQHNYEEAWHISECLLTEDKKLYQVNTAFLKGQCLWNMDKKTEAIKEFNYVIKEGNTLRFCREAKAYLKQIPVEMLHRT